MTKFNKKKELKLGSNVGAEFYNSETTSEEKEVINRIKKQRKQDAKKRN